MRKTLLLCLLLLPLMACSGKPTDSDGRLVLEAQVKRDSKGLIRVASFEKTNAIEQEMLGRQLYLLEYTAQIEFTEDVMWSGPGPFGWNGKFLATPGRPKSALDSFHPAFMGRTPGNKGETAKVTGTIIFEMAENGWRPMQNR